MSKNMRTLLATAAELRSGGASWAAVGRQVKRSARTVSNWPTRFPADWARFYKEAHQKRFTEAADEALCCLRGLLRNEDIKSRERAAVALLKLRPELPVPETLPELGETEAQKQLAQIRQEEKFDRARIDRLRQAKGLPPATNLEYWTEKARRDYQRCLDKATYEEATLSFDPHDYVKPIGPCHIAPGARGGFYDPKTGEPIPDDVMMKRLGYATSILLAVLLGCAMASRNGDVGRVESSRPAAWASAPTGGPRRLDPPYQTVASRERQRPEVAQAHTVSQALTPVADAPGSPAQFPPRSHSEIASPPRGTVMYILPTPEEFMPATAGGEPFRRLLALIDRHWGFRTLRPLQEQAMRAVLDRRDSLVVLPTGGGKSLCFQAPALLRENETTVVVSPLIALMKDQVDALRAVGAPARHIDSSLTDAERSRTFDELRAGQIRLLFVSPERLMMPAFQDFLRQLGVRTFAIDEAHCISHWGHDFRPEYRQLRTLRDAFPDAAFHGYTATATGRVRDDIVRQLGLRDPELLVGNFDRPNLVYRVTPRGRVIEQVLEFLKKHEGEAGIIYCIRRKDVDELAAVLAARGVNAVAYHAGMAAEERKAAQDAFRAERCDVVVATVAFGMGIDRSNVRFVLHAGMPKSIEHYQQEAGRAGRDGLEAECLLLANGSDTMTWKKILAKSAEENQVDPDFLPNALAHLEEISAYSRAAACRHKVLVEHFGQPFESANCGACDVCLGEVDTEPDSQEIARKILSCVARVKEGFGIGHVVSVLRGEASEKVARYGHDKLTTHGLLKEFSAAQVRDWTYQLLGLGCLDQAGDEYPVLKLNPASWEVMRNERQVPLRKAAAARGKTRKSRAEEVSWEGVDRGLCEVLRKWRRETAEARGWPPFAVFNDDTLRDLARVRPSTLPALRAVRGIGEARAQSFGTELVGIIVPYCTQNGLPLDQPGAAPIQREEPVAVSANAEAYFPHFRNGASLEEVARISGRAPGTVVRYLCAFIETERPTSVAAWVPDDVVKRVAAAAEKHGNAFLRPIFVELGEAVSYEQIRVALSYLATL